MSNKANYWIEAFEKNDVHAFLRDDARKAAGEVLSADSSAAALLSDSAVRDLEDDYVKKVGAAFTQIIAALARERIKDLDIEEYLGMKGTNAGAIDEACREVRDELLEDRGRALREKYFLVKGFEESIRKSFIASKTEFVTRLAADRNEISDVLFSGRPFTKVLELSGSGADMHRHGRTVIGVTTDAGTCYYKPHNCSLDAFYREFIGRWFSDCTIAPAVIDRGDYAFIQGLEHSEAGDRDGIRRFFRNFGCLTAGFHALGSTDMHGENIMSCGEYPCALDLETVFSYRAKPSGRISEGDRPEEDDSVMDTAPWNDYAFSALGCGVFPARLHKAGLISPLYTEFSSNKCLPRFEGRAYTVDGFEEDFIDGFREGYSRMIKARDEIEPMLERYSGGTLRLVIRNTYYYFLMMNRLFRPDALSDPDRQAKLIADLKIPYDVNGLYTNDAVVKYEAASIMNGDIPYYCSGIGSHALCGEDRSRVIQDGFLSLSGADMLEKRLSRLSETEEQFEEQLIRNNLAHAALDEPDKSGSYELSGRAASEEDVLEAIREILYSLGREEITHSDGRTISWMSTISNMESLPSCGMLTSWADTGLLCAMVMDIPELSDVHDTASLLAEQCLQGMEDFINARHAAGMTSENMPGGLGTGLGGALLSLDRMEKAGLEKAGTILRSLIDELPLRAAKKHDYSEGERGTCHPWNVQCGTAGLLTACSLIGADIPSKTVSHLADELLDGLPAAKTDGLYGSAGMAAALAYAYGYTGEERFAKGSGEVFESLRSSYSEFRKGWSAPSKGMSWASGRDPYAAGIGLAADLSLRWLECEAAEAVLAQAVESLDDEKELLAADSLNNGNALSALCCMRLSGRRPELMDRAGQILGAMLRRKDEKGVFSVSAEGVRSFFDPSFALGTTGIGCVLAFYLMSPIR